VPLGSNKGSGGGGFSTGKTYKLSLMGNVRLGIVDRQATQSQLVEKGTSRGGPQRAWDGDRGSFIGGRSAGGGLRTLRQERREAKMARGVPRALFAICGGGEERGGGEMKLANWARSFTGGGSLTSRTEIQKTRNRSEHEGGGNKKSGLKITVYIENGNFGQLSDRARVGGY